MAHRKRVAASASEARSARESALCMSHFPQAWASLVGALGQTLTGTGKVLEASCRRPGMRLISSRRSQADWQ
jgi:hypothetical protein